MLSFYWNGIEIIDHLWGIDTFIMLRCSVHEYSVSLHLDSFKCLRKFYSFHCRILEILSLINS